MKNDRTTLRTQRSFLRYTWSRATDPAGVRRSFFAVAMIIYIYVDARTRTQNSRLISGDVPDLYRYLASRNAGLLLAFQNPVSNNKRTINSNVSLAHFVIELIGVCYVL